MSLNRGAFVRLVACWAWLAVAVPAGAQEAPPAAPQGKILPEFKADDALDAVVTTLQQADSEAKIVLVRDATEMPRVRFLLRNVTVDDVLKVIAKARPEVDVDGVPGSTGMIYVIRVLPPAGRRGGGEQAAEPGVRVYNLAPAVNAWIEANMNEAGPDDRLPALRERALSHILTLIQAALSQAPRQKDPSLEVHGPTQALVFRGSREQQAALEEVLKALRPDDGSTGAARSSLVLEDYQRQIQTLRRKLDEQAEEIKRLRADSASQPPSTAK